jgi:hypothetical protein
VKKFWEVLTENRLVTIGGLIAVAFVVVDVVADELNGGFIVALMAPLLGLMVQRVDKVGSQLEHVDEALRHVTKEVEAQKDPVLKTKRDVGYLRSVNLFTESSNYDSEEHFFEAMIAALGNAKSTVKATQMRDQIPLDQGPEAVEWTRS